MTGGRARPHTIRRTHYDGSHSHVEGWVYDDAPGLAMATDGPATSTVTHLPTGRRVCMVVGPLPEREAALVRLAALADWTAEEVPREVLQVALRDANVMR